MPAIDISLNIGSLLPLDSKLARDPAQCGAKAATLARLLQAGYRVPSGFVLTASQQTPHDDELESVLSALGGCVAVRSSGIREDQPDASWAGLYESVLNVESIDALRSAIQTCRKSADSSRVRAYGEAGGVAVLVQRMVRAETAGVAFSANPVTGNREQCVVNAVRGLGDVLVSGVVDGESWTVEGDLVTRVNGGGAAETAEAVLDEAMARRVAELACALEAEFQAPQDVEWAVAGGELHLLQSRPITALPVPPQIERPPADQIWTKDTSHFGEPMTPYGASVYLPGLDGVVAEMSATWGLMVENVEFELIGHELYTHNVPFGGASETQKAPPWWLLGLLSRLLPSVRKRLDAGRRALESGLRDALVEDWISEHRPALIDELATLRAVDLERLDSAELAAHADELLAFAKRCQQLHFSLTGPYFFALYELAEVCRQHLGWDESRSLTLLQGLSSASSAPSVALAELAARLRTGPTRQVLQDAAPDWLEKLKQADARAATDVLAYLDTWGLRSMNYDPGSPTLAEQPAVFAGLLRDALSNESDAKDLEAARQRAIAEARGSLSDSVREHFEEVLKRAERIYPVREDNVMLADNLPGGLLRRLGLEYGRRLVARHSFDADTDAMLLSLAELRANLEGKAAPDLRKLVRKRQAELAWVRANPGPVSFGPAPPEPPSLRGLIPSARLLNGALIWAMKLELSAPPSGEGTLRGAPASGGKYRGRVRVIRRVEDLHRLERGEVLVCPITNPAWSVLFSRAGALITDAGSVLSHAAIIAREHAVPAVVATGSATSVLLDGMDVTVDGNTGSIVIH